MVSAVVRLNRRNQIVLPRAAREALGVEPGGRVQVVVDGEHVCLLPEPESWAETIYGLGEEMWAALGGGEQFLREQRAAWSVPDAK